MVEAVATAQRRQAEALPVEQELEEVEEEEAVPAGRERAAPMAALALHAASTKKTFESSDYRHDPHHYSRTHHMLMSLLVQTTLLTSSTTCTLSSVSVRTASGGTATGVASSHAA